MQERSYLRELGGLDNIFRTAGHDIYTEHVNAVFCTVPYVFKAVLYGVGIDDRWFACAALALSQPKAFNGKTLAQHVKSRLQDYEVSINSFWAKKVCLGCH